MKSSEENNSLSVEKGFWLTIIVFSAICFSDGFFAWGLVGSILYPAFCLIMTTITIYNINIGNENLFKYVIEKAKKER
jgi:hypothetical protein